MHLKNPKHLRGWGLHFVLDFIYIDLHVMHIYIHVYFK